MKIQIASDLHLEFAENRKWLLDHPLEPKGELLLLAGDIITDKHKKKAAAFYDTIEADFPRIISTMGNHEFYHGHIHYAYPEYEKQITSHHIKLNNQTIIIDDLKIIASTLWSYIPENLEAFLYQKMNDYHCIFKKAGQGQTNILIDETNHFHRLSVDYITTELKKDFNGKIIIMTHHLPSFKCIVKDYQNKELLKYAFASDLDYLFSQYKIDLWIFGHIHESVDIRIANTRLVSNPLGYMTETQKMDFKNDFVIEV